MNEADWTSGTDPITMIEFLRGSPTGEDAASWGNNRWQDDQVPTGRDRKFRLFACACCRRIWDGIPEVCNRDAVAAVEQFTDGQLTGPQLREALQASSAVEWLADGSGRRQEPGYWAVKYLGRGFYKLTAGASALKIAATVICMADGDYGPEAEREFNTCFYAGNGVFLRPFRWLSPVPAAVASERDTLADLLRDIFANPFRPVAFDPSWRTPSAVALAAGMYAARDFAPLPVLADALEDAGCDHPDILSHCRGAGPHVRGCWVVDLVLGKG